MIEHVHGFTPFGILDGILSIPVRHGYRIRGRHAERTAVYCAAAVHPDAVVVDLRRQGVDDRETVCARLPVLPVRLQRGGVCLHEKIRDAGFDQQCLDGCRVQRPFCQMQPRLYLRGHGKIGQVIGCKAHHRPHAVVFRVCIGRDILAERPAHAVDGEHRLDHVGEVVDSTVLCKLPAERPFYSGVRRHRDGRAAAFECGKP